MSLDRVQSSKQVMFVFLNKYRVNSATVFSLGLYSREPSDVVSFAAVTRVVTRRFSPTNMTVGVTGGEALRDDPDHGCGGD